MLIGNSFVLGLRHGMLSAGFLYWYRVISRRFAPHHIRRDAGCRPNDEQADGCQFPLIHVRHGFPPGSDVSALVLVSTCIITPVLPMLARYLIGSIKTVFAVTPLIGLPISLLCFVDFLFVNILFVLVLLNFLPALGFEPLGFSNAESVPC